MGAVVYKVSREQSQRGVGDTQGDRGGGDDRRYLDARLKSRTGNYQTQNNESSRERQRDTPGERVAENA